MYPATRAAIGFAACALIAALSYETEKAMRDKILSSICALSELAECDFLDRYSDDSSSL